MAKYDLIVVGGGASGLMAAGRAAACGASVLLLEKNPKLGEKLKISGGGRCNITNAQEDTRLLLKAYGKAEPFLHSLFSQFGVADTFSFFESRGLPLVVEANNRAFPKTQKATDVLAVLEKYARTGGVEIRTNSPVLGVLTEGNVITGIRCASATYEATRYLFATGSFSHPETGSTGDGLAWLRTLGHTVVDPTPTIVPLAVKDEWVKSLAGVAIPSMKISFFADGKKQFSEQGKILCTHFGLSGPLILNAAHKVADLLHLGSVTASIDLYPKEDQGILERRIITIFDANKNKTLKNVLKDIVPEGMSRGVGLLLGETCDMAKKAHSITKEERKAITKLLKALPVSITGLMGFDRAVVADGGVPLSEIDMKTMRSKKVANLSVTGDLLHINRPSGGFSLQLCWSTGYVAGSNIL